MLSHSFDGSILIIRDNRGLTIWLMVLKLIKWRRFTPSGSNDIVDEFSPGEIGGELE